MKRTLIALLATAVISLPAAAQQTDMRQGQEQDQDSRLKAQSMERGTKGSQRATNQNRGRGGGNIDRAGRIENHQYGTSERAGRRLRGRTSYSESRRGERAGRQFRGRTGYYESRGGYGYVGGRRVYGRNCPRYIYHDGRRVLNERCLSGRGAYTGNYERHPRYSYYSERGYSTRYGGRRGGAYVGQRTSVREYGRSGGGKGAGTNERHSTSAGLRGQKSGQAGQMNGSQGNRASRSARNRSRASQTQTESQPGTR